MGLQGVYISICGDVGWGEWYVMLHLPLLLSNQEGYLELPEWVEAV